MQVQLRHQPSFAVGRVMLAPGEPVFDFAGPGQIMTQTHTPSAPALWVRQQSPGR
ncbi:hypothetical protein GCM10009676_22040 [Prauserella halophila]|uniref:Uncharacterized protein n=1 Tax=Prauserella halophila TaxID=185641 RepID=A0ABN1W609_9PSEU|nr:hypothetical protein [Prauserella halophila]MCP2235603.1 hypothetical protein [Prauserella halophila]